MVVDIEWTGISTGTERLLWAGRMPPFPGLGYPLVPGYESVGRIVEVGARSGRQIGERVFVPGAKCYGEVRGLFGGAAAKVVVPGSRVTTIGDNLREEGVLLALAATAYHALAAKAPCYPDLIVGHGVLGRLIARLVTALAERPSGRVGTQSRPRGGRRRLHRHRPGRRHAPRLSNDLRCQRRQPDPRHADRPPRRRAARSCSRASTASRCPSRFRPPSCAKRASASPPNGATPTSPRSRP